MPNKFDTIIAIMDDVKEITGQFTELKETMFAASEQLRRSETIIRSFLDDYRQIDKAVASNVVSTRLTDDGYLVLERGGTSFKVPLEHYVRKDTLKAFLEQP